MRRNSVVGLVCLFALFLTAHAQTVIKTVRLQNHVEGSTLITSGPHANTIAYIDGYNVYGLPAVGGKSASATPLFSTLGLPIRVMPRGIAYLRSEQRFAFTVNLDPTVIYLTDRNGVVQENLQITWPAGQELPTWVEGIVWAGQNDPNFSNHFLVAVNFSDGPARIATIRRDGTVDGLIAPSQDIFYGSGLAYRGQNQLLLTDANSNQILMMDVKGNVQQTLNPGIADVEGITPLPNGNTAFFGNDNGLMQVVDRNFQPVPSLTRNFLVGTGIGPCRGIGWNTDAATFMGVCERYDSAQSGLWNIAPDASSASQLVDYSSFPGFPPYGDPVYLPDQHLIATAVVGASRAIQFYTPSGQDAGGYQINYGPLQSYIPSTHQIVGASGPSGLVFFDALTGSNLQYVDLSSLGITKIDGIAYFEAGSSGRLLVFDYPSETAFILNLDGTLVSSFNYFEKLGVLNPSSASRMDSGSYAGDFIVYENDPENVVIFSLN